MLRSDLCDFSEAYIVAKGTITVTNPDNNAHDKKLTFKNNAPFEGNNTEKEVEIVVPLKHLSNFRRTLDMLLSNCEKVLS